MYDENSVIDVLAHNLWCQLKLLVLKYCSWRNLLVCENCSWTDSVESCIICISIQLEVLDLLSVNLEDSPLRILISILVKVLLAGLKSIPDHVLQAEGVEEIYPIFAGEELRA